MILAAWYHPVLAVLFAFVALFLILVILLQRGRGVGLAGAFGGGGGVQTAFGAKTGDFLTWATIVIASILLLFAVILNYIFVPEPALQEQTPATPPAQSWVVPPDALPHGPAIRPDRFA